MYHNIPQFISNSLYIITDIVYFTFLNDHYNIIVSVCSIFTDLLANKNFRTHDCRSVLPLMYLEANIFISVPKMLFICFQKLLVIKLKLVSYSHH